MVPWLSFVFALVLGAFPWLTKSFGWKPLVACLVLGIAVAIVGAVFSIVPFPWTDVIVLVVALSGGILVGRAIPKRFTPMFLLLLAFSALDIAQSILTSGGSSSSNSVSTSPFYYGNFLIPLPLGRFNLGILDILFITAIAEYWRRRSNSIIIAEIPGVACFVIADLFIAITAIGNLPLIPFLTIGWLTSGALARLILKPRRRENT